jgi:hypothetical protein
MTIAPPRIEFPPHVQLTPCDPERHKPTPDDLASVGGWIFAELRELRAAEHAAALAVDHHGPDSPVARTRRRAVDAHRDGYAFWLHRYQHFSTGAYAITF